MKFKVVVLKCNIPQDNLEVRYEISEDMMKPHQTGKQPLKNEKLEINAGTMKKKDSCVAVLLSLAKGVSMKAWLPSAFLLKIATDHSVARRLSGILEKYQRSR